MAVVTARYTRDGRPDAEARVQADLSKLVSACRVVGPRAVVLAGAFGRGEGVLVSGVSGERPDNDYDLLIVTDSPVSTAQRTAVLRETAAAAPVPVDVAFVTAVELANAPPVLFFFDLKHGGRVIAGDFAILGLLPELALDGMPPLEALRLTLNRGAGILGATTALAPPGPSRDIRVQLTKALVGAGDALLILSGRYAVQLSQRLEILRRATANWKALPAPMHAAIVEAYSAKLHGRYSSASKRDVWEILERVSMMAMRAVTKSEDNSWREQGLLFRRQRARHGGFSRGRLMRRLRAGIVPTSWSSVGFRLLGLEPCDVVHSVLPAVMFAPESSIGVLAEVWRVLHDGVATDPRANPSAAAYAAWSTWCH